MIDNPKDVIWAESSAAPVFGELAQFMLDYFEVEPTKEFSAQDLANFAQKHNYLAIDEEDEDKEGAEDEKEGDKEMNREAMAREEIKTAE